MQRSFIADCRLIEALEQRSISVQCQADQVLFKQGEPCKGLYFVKSGELSLVLAAENGVEVMRLIVGPGSLLGVPAVVSGGPYTLTGTALTGAEVGFVELGEFTKLMADQPALFPLVLAVLAAGIRAGRLALTRIMSEHNSQASAAVDSAFSI